MDIIPRGLVFCVGLGLFAAAFAAWASIIYFAIRFYVACFRAKLPLGVFVTPWPLRRDLPDAAMAYRRRALLAMATFLTVVGLITVMAMWMPTGAAMR